MQDRPTHTSSQPPSAAADSPLERRRLLTSEQDFVGRYASTHGSHHVEKDAAWYEARQRFFGHRVRAWLPSSKDAAILDLACGTGELLRMVDAMGYTAARGIDLSEEQLAIARRQGVTNVACEDLFDHLKAHPSRYDFVIASHIIEHLERHQVVDFLRDLGASLTPRGVALVLTPNAGSPLGLPYSFGDFTHTLYFTGMSLAQVAAMARLEIRHIGGIRPAGRAKAVGWAVTRRALEAVLGDRRMKYGSIMEPELLGVFSAPP